MSSRRRLRLRRCEGKVKHETYANAEGAMRSADRVGRVVGRVRIYACSFCRKYHWGHY